MKRNRSTFLVILFLNILCSLSFAENSELKAKKIYTDCSNPVNAIVGSNQIANYDINQSYYSSITMPKAGKLFISSLNENAADIKIYRDDCEPENLVGTKLEGFGATARLESTLFTEGTVILIEWTFQENNFNDFEWDLFIEEWNSINQSCGDATQAFPFFSNSNFIPDPQPNSSYFFYFSPGFFENATNGRFSIIPISEVDGVEIKVHNSSQCPNNEFGISNNGYLLTSELTATVVIIEFGFPNTVSTENFEWTFDFVLSSDLMPQEINFNELPIKKYGDEDFILQATSTSDLPIYYESLAPEIASISDNIVTIHSGGEVIIRATQTGDARVGFLPAIPVEQLLVIQKVNLNAFPIADTISYGSPIPDFEIIYDGFINNDTRNDIKVEPNIVTNAIQSSDVGNYIIRAEGGLDSNYYFTYFQDTLVIQRSNQNITLNTISNKTVLDEDFEVIANIDSDLELVFEIMSGPASINENIISLDGNIGTIELKISQEGNSNYYPAELITYINVNKAEQIITIDSIETKTTTSSPFVVNAIVSSGLPLDYVIINGPASIDGNRITLNSSPGTVELLVSQSGNESYSSAEVTIKFDVIIDYCLNFDIENIVIKNVSCFEEINGSIEIEMSGTAPFKFSINDGEFTEINKFENLLAGTYLIKVNDINDCSLDTLLTITQPDQINIESLITPSTTYKGNGEIDLSVVGGSGSYTFLWNNGETTEDLKELTPGKYSVIISDSNNCEIEFYFTVGGVTVIKPHHELTKVYPNPVKKQLFIEFHQNNNLLRFIRIYDEDGKIIKEVKSNNNQTLINLYNLSNGIYFIQIDEDKHLKKIVKN